MGDRTWVIIEARDTAATRAILEDYSDEIETGGVLLWAQCHELNYGGRELRKALASAGVSYVGSHGSGGAYTAAMFYNQGKGDHAHGYEDGYIISDLSQAGLKRAIAFELEYLRTKALMVI